ncbi:MAG: hypothetical protein ACT4QD_18425 [Acidobacteriota bacterium]
MAVTIGRGVALEVLPTAMTTALDGIARFRREASAVVAALVVTLVVLQPPPAHAQITAQVRAASPAWDKGIQAISPESYYHAIECGKQGGANPACVFWDTDVCKNDDFTLAWYTPYKQVAYEVWMAVQRQQPPPQPDYQAAQRTRVTIALTPVKGAGNALTEFRVIRAGKPAVPRERSISGGGGRFTFDYPAFAATGAVTLEMVGSRRTLSCAVPPSVLRQFR